MPMSKKASTPKRKRMWQHVEDSMKARGMPPGRAAAAANAAVAKDVKRKKRKRKTNAA
jgi:hypothetical protein